MAKGRSESFQRAVDLVLFVPAACIFAIPILTIAAVIRLFDGEPIFFRQTRIGLNQRLFEVLKFRTMRDGQVTRVGTVLRKTGLDELPQFFNVLKGDISFVGPRPLTQEDVQRLGWTGHGQAFRWRIKPGITGLAQIYAGQGARASLIQDYAYYRYRSLSLDIRILGVTFLMNLFGKGRVRKVLHRSYNRDKSRERAVRASQSCE